ncbi:MAG: hypothetical protein WCG75_04365 [Armatimonadota bacterium]
MSGKSATSVKPNLGTPTSVDSLRAKAKKRNRQFKGVQFAKKLVTTASVGIVAGSAMLNSATSGGGADGAFRPGKDRWTVKTSMAVTAPFTTVKPMDMIELEIMPHPVITSPQSAFDNAWIPSPVDGFQEGQIVTTTGYVHYVQYKADDSDYHIQMNEMPTNELQDLNPCVVVEVPHPMATNNAELSQKFAMVRKFLRDNCFGGKVPKGKVDKVIKVQITGQLFFDVFHFFQRPNDPGGGRGSQLEKGLPMHATTNWEIHPIIDIQLAP